MKGFCRIATILLVLAQLFVISAAAGSDLQASLDEMADALSGPVAASGVTVVNPTSPSGKGDASESGTAKSADSAGKTVDYEIAPVTKTGNAGDVMIGGLEIRPGVWYTVDGEGKLTSSEPWPDSYLYYSASQSKITLHEFSYVVSSEMKGKEETFAGLYIPKNMRIVLEGDNELLNYSYTTANDGYSNGIYAGDNAITFDGSGALRVNTLADESLKGYGIAAGRIRIEGDFIGLSVFGMSGAFNVAPEVNEAREMVVRVGKIHPDYHGGSVREGNPYDGGVFTRYRYVLFAVGKELSEWEQMKARAYADAYGAKADFEDQVEAEQILAWQNYNTEVDNSMQMFNQGLEEGIASYNNGIMEWQNNFTSEFTDGYNSFSQEMYEMSDAASQLGQMLITGGD